MELVMFGSPSACRRWTSCGPASATESSHTPLLLDMIIRQTSPRKGSSRNGTLPSPDRADTGAPAVATAPSGRGRGGRADRVEKVDGVAVDTLWSGARRGSTR